MQGLLKHISLITVGIKDIFKNPIKMLQYSIQKHKDIYFSNFGGTGLATVFLVTAGGIRCKNGFFFLEKMLSSGMKEAGSGSITWLHA